MESLGIILSSLKVQAHAKKILIQDIQNINIILDKTNLITKALILRMIEKKIIFNKFMMKIKKEGVILKEAILNRKEKSQGSLIKMIHLR